ELRLRPGPGVRVRGGGERGLRRGRPGIRAGAGRRPGPGLRARRRPPSRGPQRSAGPEHDGLSRVLAAVGRALGVPVADPGAGRRRRGTLDAGEALAEARLLEDSVAHALGEAFVFLSDVKDALEVDRRVSAEVLPAGPAEQFALARRLGYEEYARQAFLDDYR